MDKNFENYLHITRNEFVEAVNQLQWNKGFRTKCENLLIAFDQMKQELRKLSVNDMFSVEKLEQAYNDGVKDALIKGYGTFNKENYL